MEKVQPYIDQAYGFVQTGFATVNDQVMALIIALIAAVIMKSWGKLLHMTLGAVVVHWVAATLMPVAKGGDFKLPELLSSGFWMTTASLAVGYLIVISVFFFIKKNVLKAG